MTPQRGPASVRRRCPASRRPTRGFTLIELTVALLAGLLVAMGIVGLSREATSTFHEEARSSSAEAALRTAVDRLRADLQRAGYMSTGDIASAPRIAFPLGGPRIPANAQQSALSTLRSIALKQGGSLINGIGLSALQPIPLNPDLIQITGNMTSSEQFDVVSYSTTAQANCTRIYLASNSPAVFRVLGIPPNGTELHNVFFPSSLGTDSYQFIVRLVDANQCAQYLLTCTNSPQVAGLDPQGLPYVDVDSTTPLVTTNATGGSCGVSGFGENSFVNPVQIVQWEITTSASEPASYSALGGAVTGTKYDLMRSYVNAKNGNGGGPAIPIPDTREIVAEYVVDLSFAFSVDTGTAAAPAIQTLPFDDMMTNPVYAPPPGVAAGVTPGQGPARIRSVRARLVTRAALPDRALNIPVAPANFGNQAFAYRYCVAPNGCANNANGGLRWARTRTITTEVALPNQAGNFYP